MDWLLLVKALCLMCVIEGIPLFLSPARVREAAALVQKMNDSMLRALGLAAMLAGSGLLLLLRSGS